MCAGMHRIGPQPLNNGLAAKPIVKLGKKHMISYLTVTYNLGVQYLNLILQSELVGRLHTQTRVSHVSNAEIHGLAVIGQSD